MLALFASLWGLASLADGYHARIREEMDDAMPLTVALADGVTMDQAESLAAELRRQPGVKAARVLGAEAALGALLPKDQAWAAEIAGVDARHIPPCLLITIRDGVADRAAREAVTRALTAAGKTVDYVWPDGPDVSAARRRLEEAGRFIARMQWIALLLSAGAWLVFLVIDLRHFVWLVGRDRSPDPAAESRLLRRMGPTLARGALVAAGAAGVAAVGLAALPYLLGELTPAWAVVQALFRAVFFAVVAGVAGHGIVGLILWTQADRPPRVSIRV